MSELVPAADAQGVAVSLSPQPAPSLFAPLTDPAGGPAFTRLRSFAAQPPVKRMVPWFAGLSAVGLAAVAWLALSPAPQRVLYAELDDANRATVTEALDKAGITYAIDNATGTLTVDEDQLYRARMLVASEGALATPEDGTALLDSMPMGASRTLEGQRLRAARERELMMTIREIDGVESVRVHLAEGEKSVFVRDNVAPSASVMVRMARACGVTFAIHSRAVPIATPEARRADALRWGDDYQLLFAAAAGFAPPVPATRIGEALPSGPAPLLLDGQPLDESAGLGFEHG